jgi:hypothetical protein
VRLCCGDTVFRSRQTEGKKERRRGRQPSAIEMRLSSHDVRAMVATLVAVTALLVANWVVPGTSQCSVIDLANLDGTDLTNIAPSVAQRILIGSQSVIITSLSMTLSSGALPLLYAQQRASSSHHTFVSEVGFKHTQVSIS